MRQHKSLGHLVRNLFLYFPLILTLICCLISVLYLSRELTSISSAIDRQVGSAGTCLVGFAYSYRDPFYKKELVLRSNPAVLALGSSRVMQIRKFFFTGSTKFVNAGGGVANLHEFVPFLESIKHARTPEVIVISLDQYFFNENWSRNKFKASEYEKSITTEKNALDIISSSYRNVMQDVFQKKIDFNRLLVSDSNRKIGMTAIMKSDGFRGDGSYMYGSRNSEMHKWYDYEFKETFKRIKLGNNRFEYGKDVSLPALIELEKLLAYCKRKHIYVVAFLPPYAPSVVRMLKQYGPSYEYIWKIDQAVLPIFRKYSYSFFNFTDMTRLGSTDQEFIDGFHGSEITYARLFLEMSKQDKVLCQYANSTELVSLMSHQTSDTMLLEDEFGKIFQEE